MTGGSCFISPPIAKVQNFWASPRISVKYKPRWTDANRRRLAYHPQMVSSPDKPEAASVENANVSESNIREDQTQAPFIQTQPRTSIPSSNGNGKELADSETAGWMQIPSSDFKLYSTSCFQVYRSNAQSNSSTISKPIVVFLPGLDNKVMPYHQRDRLHAHGFDVVCMVQTNGIRPSWNDVKYQGTAILKAVSSSGVILIGESFGGAVALQLALHLVEHKRYKHLLHRLVLINSASALNEQSVLASAAKILPLVERTGPLATSIYPYAAFVLWRIITERDRLHVSQQVNNKVDIESAPLDVSFHRISLIRQADASSERLKALEDIPVLVIASKRDKLLKSKDEAMRLKTFIGNSCSVMLLSDSGHACLLEDDVNLGDRIADWISTKSRTLRAGDGVDPNFRHDPNVLKLWERYLAPWNFITSPQFLGEEHLYELKRFQGQRPILFVGNHCIHGILDMSVLMQHLITHGFVLRPMAHKSHFEFYSKLTSGKWLAALDDYGAVRATPRNYIRLLAANSSLLLFPGGAEEVCRRKGDRYEVKWKQDTDFVRAAMKYNAIIVPFSAIGADDMMDILLDTEEQLSLPVLGSKLRELLTNNNISTDHLHPVTSFPHAERFYFKFHKPVYTYSSCQEDDREIYQQVKNAVLKGIDELLEVQTRDPGRYLQGRLLEVDWT